MSASFLNLTLQIEGFPSSSSLNLVSLDIVHLSYDLHLYDLYMPCDLYLYAIICLCPKNDKSQNWGNAPSETGSFDGEEWAEDVDYDPAAQVAGEEYFDDKWGEDLNEESSLAKDGLLHVFVLCIVVCCWWSLSLKLVPRAAEKRTTHLHEGTTNPLFWEFLPKQVKSKVESVTFSLWMTWTIWMTKTSMKIFTLQIRQQVNWASMIVWGYPKW